MWSQGLSDPLELSIPTGATMPQIDSLWQFDDVTAKPHYNEL
jgi:hypothetical protein